MIKILKPNKKMREMLSFTPLQYMIDSIEENPKLADLYINEAENSCFALLGVYLFVGGEASKEALDYLDKQILTEKARKNLGIIIVFYPNKDWENAINNLFPNKNNIYARSVYRIKPTRLYDDFSSNQGVNISRINSELLSSNLENLSMIFNEVTSYVDMNDFINRGIGFSPIVNNKVCGFCTSEYPTKNEIAIGIEVLSEYQKQGIAKTMTKMLLNEAYKRNLTVYWECWKNNIASSNTALSCGFEKVSDYPVIFVEI
jgi:GNAT superfamily N-acetyltransferase